MDFTILFTSLCFISGLKLVSVTVAEEDVRVIKIVPPVQSYSASSDYALEVPEEHVRVSRQASTCRHPRHSDDSEIFCKYWPSRTLCIHTCMWGHTFLSGVRKRMICRNNYDAWSPTPRFEKCLPFVDCTVSLGPGGKMKCYTHFMKHGPVCQISCKHYEDKRAVPTRTYRCNLNGGWTPRLPFCATAGSGLSLVPAPRG